MASAEAFADTSALYAAVDARDAYHRDTAPLVRQLAQAGRMIITTDYIVAETLNLAVARRGRIVADRLLQLLETSSGLRIEWIDPERFLAAKAFFRKHADHDYSFTDCTSFVVMRELRIRDALTSDHHFVEAGFRSLLSAGRHTWLTSVCHGPRSRTDSAEVTTVTAARQRSVASA
jgi:predicted nucleic acid-binding protein